MKFDASRNIFAKLVPLALIGAFALGACGIKGDLQTPPPLWGDKGQQSETDSETGNKSTEEKQESNN